MSTGNTKPVDAEVVDAEPKHLIRHPGAPTNLNELAGRKGEAVEIIEARVQVVETLRRASIRLTSPADWLLFKAPDDQGGHGHHAGVDSQGEDAPVPKQDRLEG